VKRFDRLISILLQLQTSRLLTAAELAARYTVSERTIYRDMRSLETAGVPLVAETGLGYYLDRGYQLPAVNFSPDEAIALLVGVKGIQAHMSGPLSQRATSAMDKLLAVMDSQQRENIRTLQGRIAVDGADRSANNSEDKSFDSCQQALMTRRQLLLSYTAKYNGKSSQRTVEPVGLSHYGGHWHLIAWCQLRDAMRDFRLDRIESIEIQADSCPARPEQTLESYFLALKERHTLSKVEVSFDADKAHFVGMEKYRYGYLGSEQREGLEVMSFLTAYPEYLGRWLLSYTHAVRHVDGADMPQIMQTLYNELSHYTS